MPVGQITRGTTGHQPAAPRRPLDRAASRRCGAPPTRSSSTSATARARSPRSSCTPGSRGRGPTSRSLGLEIDPGAGARRARSSPTCGRRDAVRADRACRSRSAASRCRRPTGGGPRSSARSTCCGSTTRRRSRRLAHACPRGCAPGGLLVEGTCDELGRVASWVAVAADAGPRTLHDLAAARRARAPSIVGRAAAEGAHPPQRARRARPRAARRLDARVGRARPLSAFGPVQRWEARARGAADAGWPVHGSAPLAARRAHRAVGAPSRRADRPHALRSAARRRGPRRVGHARSRPAGRRRAAAAPRSRFWSPSARRAGARRVEARGDAAQRPRAPPAASEMSSSDSPTSRSAHGDVGEHVRATGRATPVVAQAHDAARDDAEVARREVDRCRMRSCRCSSKRWRCRNGEMRAIASPESSESPSRRRGAAARAPLETALGPRSGRRGAAPGRACRDGAVDRARRAAGPSRARLALGSRGMSAVTSSARSPPTIAVEQPQERCRRRRDQHDDERLHRRGDREARLRRQEPRDDERERRAPARSATSPAPRRAAGARRRTMPSSIPSTVSSTRRGRASRTRPRLRSRRSRRAAAPGGRARSARRRTRRSPRP